MAESFRLQIPVEMTYRALVPEVAGRFAELSGGSAADAASLATAISSAIETVTVGAGPEAHVDVSFATESTGVHVGVACNGQRTSVSVKIPVAKR
jgi:D-serine deaminase-like pyridoxal phosphate-dependent protein